MYRIPLTQRPPLNPFITSTIFFTSPYRSYTICSPRLLSKNPHFCCVPTRAIVHFAATSYRHLDPHRHPSRSKRSQSSSFSSSSSPIMGVAKLWPQIESARETITLDEIPSSRLILSHEQQISSSNLFAVAKNAPQQVGFFPFRVAIDMSIWLIQAESAHDQGKNPMIK